MSLDDTFDIEKEKIIDGELGVDIPDDPDEQNLELIIKLALKAYGDLMETASFMEPKDRLKLYEMAERYLNQAKDARAKMEKLRLDREKMEKTSSKSPQNAPQEENKEEEDHGKGVSRKELTERLKPLITSEEGRDVELQPKVIVEVEYEEIQSSPTYNSGYALRFPRLKQLRDDKERSDSKEKVEALYEGQ